MPLVVDLKSTFTQELLEQAPTALPGRVIVVHDVEAADDRSSVIITPDEYRRTKHEATVLSLGEPLNDSDRRIMSHLEKGSRVVANPNYATWRRVPMREVTGTPYKLEYAIYTYGELACLA